MDYKLSQRRATNSFFFAQYFHKMPIYLIQFAQIHEEFRLPELESLSVLEGISVKYDKQEYNKESPFLLIEIESDEQATKFIARSILIKNIYALWGEGKDYDELRTSVKKHPEYWTEFYETSFKFSVIAFGATISAAEQLSIVNSFAFLGFKGEINMKNPQVHFVVIQDHGTSATAIGGGKPKPQPDACYLGRLVATGSRTLVQKFNLKKRKYLSNTSMDAELSLIMANQALATPGKLVYDPFVGSGSCIFTCAHFGAYTIGSDIDGRQIRGKGDKTLESNVEQYDLHRRVLNNLVFDIARNPWRTQQWFDAIVTDPPYGVRAGAKKLGRKDPTRIKDTAREYEGIPMHLREDYYPPTKPYEMSEVLIDLLEFSAQFLVLGGRLVYWLPTVVDEYSNEDIPQHPSMRLISNSEQNFGQWSRRLITMEKVTPWVQGKHAHIQHHHHQDPITTLPLTEQEDQAETVDKSTSEEFTDPARTPGHFAFREKYFAAFGQSRPDSRETEKN